MAIRKRNLSQVLNLIRQKGAVSRAGIVRQTGLSATTVSSLVNILLDSGFVKESGRGQSSGGRPPILLKFNYTFRHVLGVDMGATHITAVAMDLAGNVISRQSRKLDVIDHPDGAIAMICHLVKWVMSETNLSLPQVLGMGITIPAPLAGDSLNQITTIYMPKWDGRNLIEEIQSSFDLPIYLDNDANAGAIAEKWWGKGQGYENLAYIKLGIGVGSGLIIKNQIFRGPGGTAGEIGHTTINVDGPLCRCGNRGCMESYVGVPAVIEEVGQQLVDVHPGWKPSSTLTIEDITEAALAGDPVYRAVIERTGTYLGIAIANLVNLFNPELIIIGGDLAAAEEPLLKTIQRSVKRRAMPKAANEVHITTSKLGNDVVAMGAATLVIQNAFQPAKIMTILQT